MAGSVMPCHGLTLRVRDTPSHSPDGASRTSLLTCPFARARSQNCGRSRRKGSRCGGRAPAWVVPRPDAPSTLVGAVDADLGQRFRPSTRPPVGQGETHSRAGSDPDTRSPLAVLRTAERRATDLHPLRHERSLAPTGLDQRDGHKARPHPFGMPSEMDATTG